MIDEIDSRRRVAGISQKALCRAAGVHQTTYSAIKTGKRGGQVHTLDRLSAALDALIAEKGPPPD